MQTLHGNPVCASAALAVLTTIQSDGLALSAQETGRILLDEIAHTTAQQPQVGDIRGRGLAIGVELIKDENAEPDADLARKTVYRAWQLGAVFYYVGMNSNVLELTPPLIISEDEAKTGAQILAQAIKDATSGMVGDDDIAEFAGW
jgi:4-aminobutyrate aminotransferase